MGKSNVIFCTALGNNFGIGHFQRCVAIIEEATRENYQFEPFIYIYKGDKKLKRLYNYRFIDDLKSIKNVDLIVSDMRDTTEKEITDLCRIAPVISLDDSGEGSNYAYVNIHALPTVNHKNGNYNGPEYIVLNRAIRKIKEKPFNERNDILISFGGEDPFNLTYNVASILSELGIRPKIIRGPINKNDLTGLDADIIECPESIYELIGSAKLLITSFGITMYEAFFLKTPVALLNHTNYHNILANTLPVMNIGSREDFTNGYLKEKISRIISNERILIKKAKGNSNIIDGNGARRVIDIMQKAIVGKRKDCLFGHKRYKAISRTNSYTLFQCTRCDDVFIFKLKEEDSIYGTQGFGTDYYGNDYFISDYKAQYGKTYKDDKTNIVNNCKKRIEIIERIKGGNGKILDIGCAMGFFLEVAKNRGWEEYGVEISEYAGGWARKRLLLNVKTASFIDIELKENFFDAVTLFYVAEHFKDIEKVIKKVYSILKPKGVIAIAMPNCRGISFRFNRSSYISKHPIDHYIDTNPKNLKRFLKDYGFVKKKIVTTGIHPDRFFNKIGIGRTRLLDMLYIHFAKLLRLGDTFEYYGIKK